MESAPFTTDEVRVLGCLIEKEITTPEYYPLTLNALVNACNQKSNRDPVVQLSDRDVEEALSALKARRLALEIHAAGSRAVKHGHRVGETWNFGRREVAVLCVLMLRGPQTLGEIRDRTGRMHEFTDLDEVERVLDKLSSQDFPFVVKLHRLPGMKEHRYGHLLCGAPTLQITEDGPPRQTLSDQVDQLRTEVAQLREEIDRIKQQLGI
jgi:uncharacterized protein YceH (UPF0502 family)